jgi:hypothetical protein
MLVLAGSALLLAAGAGGLTLRRIQTVKSRTKWRRRHIRIFTRRQC